MGSFARITACALVVVALASCRTAPPRGAIPGPGADAPWAEQRAALADFDRYALNGRVAVAANGQGFSASLRYQQMSERVQLSLDGPLGIGGLRVDAEGDDLEIASSRGDRFDGPAARAELERRLGFALPLREMRWWLLGVPAPGDAAVNAADDGEIRDFTQAGWRVSINSRVPGLGFSLPQRLTAERMEEGGERARLKLLVERWQ
jgi:outer membrane lipoprotein LolB